MQSALIALLRGYRYVVSPFMAPHCRFYPTCSEYALIAIGRYGTLRGGWMAIQRLARCHPLHPGGVDPLPGEGDSRP